MSARRLHRWGLGLALLALAGLGASMAWPGWKAAPTTAPVAAADGMAAQQQRERAAVAAAADAAGAEAASAARAPVQAWTQVPAGQPPDTPPGITPAAWARLQARLANQPDGPAELRRLEAYYRYADAVQRFRELSQRNPASPELPALARTLDAGLAERLQQGEVSAPEARLLKMAVLQATVPEAAQRERALAQWEQQIEQWRLASASVDTQARLAREADFQRRQAALLAAWQAQPPAQRDPRQLQQQLDALRRDSFPHTGP